MNDIIFEQTWDRMDHDPETEMQFWQTFEQTQYLDHMHVTYTRSVSSQIDREIVQVSRTYTMSDNEKILFLLKFPNCARYHFFDDTDE